MPIAPSSESIDRRAPRASRDGDMAQPIPLAPACSSRPRSDEPTLQPVFVEAMTRELVPGDWRTDEHRTDYRVERLSDLLVERATWRESAPVRHICGTTVSAPGYIWFRFWLLRDGNVVEKYFDDEGRPVGMYAPVSMPFSAGEDGLGTIDLTLALWVANDGQVIVLNEDKFDHDVRNDFITPAQAAVAEDRIREMTLETARGQFPPPIIRNFELGSEQER